MSPIIRHVGLTHHGKRQQIYLILLIGGLLGAAKNCLAEFNAASLNNSRNVKLWISDFKHQQLDGALLPFSLHASELMIRLRRGRVMDFNQYQELYCKQLNIVQTVDTPLINLQPEVFKDINPDPQFNAPTSDQAGIADSAPALPAEQTVYGNTLNRVNADQLSLRFEVPKHAPVILTAKQAHLLTDNWMMRLRGDVSINARHCHIKSEQAVWSTSEQGMYLPGEFRMNRKWYHKPVFIQISRDGKCLKQWRHAEIAYSDRLEELEAELLAKMPIEYLLLFGGMSAE